MTTTKNVKGGFEDTTMTKVFIGGLAWDTSKETIYDHFIKYGHILESVIITDKLTRRSKGYGFVTFRDVDAAKRACENSTPVINGRRANCNLASLGGRGLRRSPSVASQAGQAGQAAPQQGSKGGNRSTSAQVGNHGQWYYPVGFSGHHHQAVPFYGYPSPYITPGLGFNQKGGHIGGAYMTGRYGQVQLQPQPRPRPQPQYYHHMYGGGVVMGTSPMMPLYTMYPYQYSSPIA